MSRMRKELSRYISPRKFRLEIVTADFFASAKPSKSDLVV